MTTWGSPVVGKRMLWEHLAAGGWLENSYCRIALCHSRTFLGVRKTVPIASANARRRYHPGQHGHLE